MCSRIGRLLAATAVVLAQAVPLRALAPELVGRPVRSIRIECDLPIDEDGIRQLLPFRLETPLTAELLTEAERLLVQKSIFRSVNIDVEPVDDGVAIRIELERVRVVGTVRASGYQALRRDDIRRLIRLEPGVVYEPGVAEAVRERIRKRYTAIGFASVEIGIEEEQQAEAVDLAFYIREGRALTIRGITIEGDDVLDAVALERALRQARATPWTFTSVFRGAPEARWTRDDRRKIQGALIQALRQSGYYEARVVCTFLDMEDTVEGLVSCRVEAGARHVVEIVGNRALSRDDLLPPETLNQRLLITDGTWRELGREMVRTYQAAGYYRATVRAEVEGEDPKQVRFIIEEGGRYHVGDVRFTGNRILTTEQLRTQMATRPPSWSPWSNAGRLQDDVLDDDLRRLWFLYREQGFDRAEIVDARRVVDDDAGTIDLEIVVDEGPRTVVREVRFEGLPDLRTARPALQLDVGQALGPERLKNDRQALTLALAREGYPEAQVEARVNRTPSSAGEDATILWHVTPGPQRRIGRIIVQNNIDTRDVVITRELPFKSGDPLDTGKLLDAQSKIYQVGLFRSVLVRPLDPDPTRPAAERDVGVFVIERPPGRLEWGIGFNTRDGAVGSVDVRYDNLAGMNRRVGARLQVALDPTDIGSSQYLATVNFREPRLLGSEWKLQTDVIGERSTESIDPYSFERAAWIVGVERKLWPTIRFGTEVQTEYRNVFDVDPDAELTKVDEGPLHAVTPAVFLLLDRRDSVFVPRVGTFDSIRLAYSLPAVSTVESLKVTGGHIHYVPLPHDLTVLYALRAGWGRALSGSSQLPISERFFLGGRSTVRGFGENDVGPRGQDGAPLGGDVSLNANLELQFPLIYGFAGAVFVDGGAVYLQNSNELNSAGEPFCAEFCAFSLDNFRRSAGLGLRYITPIGPLSLDYGFKLDRRGDESIGAIHFSVGALF